MMEAAIEARELRYTYEDGTAALKGINLRAERGRITGILGANGAGKSTLFLNLNGVLQPSAGEILLDGAPYCPCARQCECRLPIFKLRIYLFCGGGVFCFWRASHIAEILTRLSS